MPGMSFLGRRLGVGGDEFALPSLCSMALRVCWSGALILMLAQAHATLSGCRGNWFVYTYFGVSTACFAAAVGTEWAIVGVSLRGAITDTDARSGLSALLVIHMVLGGLQVLLAAAGFVGFATFETDCPTESESGVEVDAGFIRALLLIVSLSQVIDVLAMACCCCLVAGQKQDDVLARNSRAIGSDDVGLSYERLAADDIERQWADRCRGLCKAMSCLSCRIFGGHDSVEADFAHLARVVARIFHTEEYLDVVPSDVAAGIVLLRATQREQQQGQERSRQQRHPTEDGADTGDIEVGLPQEPGTRRRSSVTDPGAVPRGLVQRSREHTQWWRVAGRQLLDVSVPEERSLLEETVHFGRYALAIYTWYLYVFERPCCGGCDLCLYGTFNCTRRYHRRQRKQRLATMNSDGSSSSSGSDREVIKWPVITGDNMCRIHEAGLLRVAGLHNCELVSAAFSSDLDATPYAMLVDHKWRSVVIAIRGTMSLDDCIVDALAEPYSLGESGRRWGFDGESMFAHRGVVDRAEWIRRDIEEKGLLRALLHGDDSSSDTPNGSSSSNSNISSSSGRPRRVSAASVLASSCKGYSLRVTGHSLGGGTAVLLTHMLRAQYPHTRCIAISPPGGLMDAAHAAACRPFVVSLVFHNDMVPRASVDALEKMRDSVLDLIGRAKVNKATVMRAAVRQPRPAVSSLLYDAGEPAAERETTYHRQLRSYKAWVHRQSESRQHCVLHPPGTLLHLVKTDRTKLGRGKYTPVWASPEDFSELIVSGSMFTDHWPTRMVPCLVETLKDLLAESDLQETRLDTD